MNRIDYLQEEVKELHDEVMFLLLKIIDMHAKIKAIQKGEEEDGALL